MRLYSGILVAVVMGSAGLVQTVAAQTAQQGWMFYNPSFSRSFQPRPSSFGGGIKTGVSGDFLYPTQANETGFAAPWRPPAPAPVSPVVEPSAAQRVLQVSPVVAVPQAANVAIAETSTSPSATAVQPATNMAPANMPMALPLDIPSGLTEQSEKQTGSASASESTAPYVYSPGLSQLMTRVARNKGVLVGRDIRVFQSNRTVLIDGTVSTSYARNLLANVLALEPDVGRIDNRLTVGYQPHSIPAIGP